MKKIMLILGMAILCAASARSQVRMMPMLVFIDPATRSGQMTLINSENEAKEVMINFKGAPTRRDSLLKDSLEKSRKDTSAANILLKDSANYSLTSYIKVFPKKLIIPGKSERTIRFIVSLPPYLPDGSYWTALSVLTKPSGMRIINEESKKIKAGIALNIEMVTLVVYNKGKVTTNLEIPTLEAKMINDTTRLVIKYKNEGNGLFFGKLKIPIFDSKGEMVDMIYEIVTVNKWLNRSYVLSKDKFKPGKYKAELTIDSEVDEIPEARRLKYATIKKELEIVVP